MMYLHPEIYKNGSRNSLSLHCKLLCQQQLPPSHFCKKLCYCQFSNFHDKLALKFWQFNNSKKITKNIYYRKSHTGMQKIKVNRCCFLYIESGVSSPVGCQCFTKRMLLERECYLSLLPLRWASVLKSVILNLYTCTRSFISLFRNVALRLNLHQEQTSRLLLTRLVMIVNCNANLYQKQAETFFLSPANVITHTGFSYI